MGGSVLIGALISCGTEVIARHPRSYAREDFVFEPLHYLALIEQEINALDQAAPLAGWRLSEEFITLRRLLEARMGKQGKREFVQVLRLMEVFGADEVAAVGDVKLATAMAAAENTGVRLGATWRGSARCRGARDA